MKRVLPIAFCLLLYSLEVKGALFPVPISLNENTSNCERVSDSMALEYVRNMELGIYDSIPKILDEWETICGIFEPQIRARLLYSIALNDYDPQLWDPYLKSSLYWFVVRKNYEAMDSINRGLAYKRNAYWHGFVTINGLFDQFCQNMAIQYLGYQDLKPSEKIILARLAGDEDLYFELLNITHRDSSIMAAQYQDEVKDWMSKSDMFMAFDIGMWDPQGKADLLGQHVQLGIEFGEGYRRWGWQTQFDVRIGKAREEFNYTKGNRWDFNTRTFTGLALTTFATYNLSNDYNKKLNLKMGVGWDGFQVKTDHPDFEDSTVLLWVNSPALVTGLQWGMRTKNASFISIAYQYHLVDYSINNRTELNGPAHSVRFSYGILGNDTRDYRLKQLQYNPRISGWPD